MSADELLAEIAAKRAEMPGAPLKEVLVALMGDAATTWKRLAMFGTVHSLGFHYPYRVFMLSWRDSPSTKYFDKLVAAIEAGKLDADFRSLIIDVGYKPRDLPSATMVRRLRVVTGEIPMFLPDPTRGVIGHDGGWYGRAKLWQLLWLDAFGMTAPKISKLLTTKSEEYWNGWRDAGASEGEIAEWRAKEKPLHRNRIWRIRAKAYNDLVAKIEPLLQPTAAAA